MPFIDKKASNNSGGGAVSSVNGQIGAVILDSNNIPFIPFATIASNKIQSAIEEIYSQMVKPSDIKGELIKIDINAPINPQYDDLWLDISKTPYTLYRFDGFLWGQVGNDTTVSASSVSFSPIQTNTATNVQSAIVNLDNKKADAVDVYSKIETENLVKNQKYDYANLTNKPDLSSLHGHANLITLNKFSENKGELAWNGMNIGNMLSSIYDKDKDGIVDVSKTLDGLLVSIPQLNHLLGSTSNIQQQINAISHGTIFKGRYANYASMTASFTNPQRGYWVFVLEDENYGGANTQYYHDGTDWIYGGGASTVINATHTTKGGVMLGGVLAHPLSSAEAPLLAPTGTQTGKFINPIIVVGEDGRIVNIENGQSAYINDEDSPSSSTTRSSQWIDSALLNKSNINHKHAELHESNLLGKTVLDETNKADKRVIGYNAKTGRYELLDQSGGSVFIGSKTLQGDFRLNAGSYINFFVDEATKTITINSTASGGNGGVPTLTEVTHTIKVNAGKSERFSLPASFSKYDIRTVNISNSNKCIVDMAIYDQSVNGQRVYLSNKEINTYDIVNVPCHDKDETKMIHFEITNYGVNSTDVSIVVKLTNLI